MCIQKTFGKTTNKNKLNKWVNISVSYRIKLGRIPKHLSNFFATTVDIKTQKMIKEDKSNIRLTKIWTGFI